MDHKNTLIFTLSSIASDASGVNTAIDEPVPIEIKLLNSNITE